MAVGKDRCLTKGGKKGTKKKMVDPFSRKYLHDVKAPAMFNISNIGKTPVTRIQGPKITSAGLKGRILKGGIFKVSLADLQSDEVAVRKCKLMEVQKKKGLKGVVNKLIPDSTGKDIDQACPSVYLLHDVFVRKVKMLKKPEFEWGKLTGLPGNGVVLEKPLGLSRS
nr:40S ribosomal protein S3a-like [Oryctolagus cuniculus]